MDPNEQDAPRADAERPATPGQNERAAARADEQEAPSAAEQRRATARRKTASAALVAALVIGGAAGATVFRTPAAQAATASAVPSTGTASAAPSTAAASAAPAASTAPAAAASPLPGTASPSAEPSEGAEVGKAGHVEAVTDTSVAANAVGITEADLDTALASGKTIAAVATANNVDPQVVIDALTKDGLDELAAQVTAGTLTQAQADAQKAAVTQRATDQVNNAGGPGGSH